MQFPDLDVKFWGSESLGKIGSILGILTKANRYTNKKSMIKYARLLIDFSLEGPFPEFIKLFNDNNVLIRQQVRFEWKPVKCTFCHMFGHEEHECKKKGGMRME